MRKLVFFLTFLMAVPAIAQRSNRLRETDDAFFKTEEARRIGEQVLLYQRVTGGWAKNIDMVRPLNEEERAAVLKDKERRDDSTTDNDATNMQLTFLARLYKGTGDRQYRDAFRRGIDYLLSGQYDNGGWPQFWPDPQGYQILNSNIWSDGNDALSLWAPNGDGMYYHADLDVRCRGVDFLCPRGWCYATRCRFEGDGHAIIWHDGRGDPSKKLVIVDSQFDAKRPTTLGRYHHDSQFYLIHCQLSKNILDENIHYAYTDKVLDPCPWGLRAYYYACTREGGHSGWLNDNLKEAKGSPEFHAVNALWTFDGRWNPERHIRDLWNVLAY